MEETEATIQALLMATQETSTEINRLKRLLEQALDEIKTLKTQIKAIQIKNPPRIYKAADDCPF